MEWAFSTLPKTLDGENRISRKLLTTKDTEKRSRGERGAGEV